MVEIVSAAEAKAAVVVIGSRIATIRTINAEATASSRIRVNFNSSRIKGRTLRSSSNHLHNRRTMAAERHLTIPITNKDYRRIKYR